MKNITKDNKGITLVALIITIIIMLILVGVTTYTGIDSYRNAEVTKFVAEMQLIQGKVDEISIEDTINIGNNVSPAQQTVINTAYSNEEITTTTGYKYFSPSDLLNSFDGLDSIEDGIMINFTTREVISEVGVEYKGKTYYTQYKLPGGQAVNNNTVSYTRDLTENITYDVTIDGLNATISISTQISNCTLRYKEENDEYWTIVTNHTEKGKAYTFIISKTGNYTLQIQDNTDNSIESDQLVLKLTNKPRTDESLIYNYASDNKEDWATFNEFVWIPRFAYKENEEQNGYDIKFIKGNSNIATDNSYIDNNWEVPSQFTINGEQLNGIWVRINDINGLDDIIINPNIRGEKELNGTSHLETEVYAVRGEEEFDGKKILIVDQIQLFSDENLEKNFIISFNKISVEDGGKSFTKDTSPTLLSAMDEDSSTNIKGENTKVYPGFNVKLVTDNGVNRIIIESNSYTNTAGDVYVPDSVTNIRILRINSVLYYSFDGEKFSRLNDYKNYRENLNPFNAPVTFGAGLDAYGNPRRYFNGIISDISIKFIDDSATIDDYNPQLRVAYAHSDPIRFGDGAGDTTIINTGLSMFKDAESLDKEFEIEFVINEIDSNNSHQAVLVNGKFENESKGWPGFVYRVNTKNGVSDTVRLEAKGATGSGDSRGVSSLINKKVKLVRRDRKIYISIDDGTEKLAFDFTNFNNYFDVPITIGASLEEGDINRPFRGFKGVLSNIIVRVEN